MKKMVTRFAPSPTGYLHVGGARTALYNYLLAKRFAGTFILRIEDTDLERSTPESIQAILDGMNWLGLSWDEGPYYQTKRFDLYKAAVKKLVDEKKAYPCFCAAETLAEKRAHAEAHKLKYGYDRTCLGLSDDEVRRRIDGGEPHVIRFRSPDHQTIAFHDGLKGDVQVESSELDDLILARSDGTPTYNLCVVIDDVSMGVTNVIRGDDHLSNTYRQIQLYQALGYNHPEFAHLPLILGTDKKRLSERHGATSVMAYKDMGYLPDALVNYLLRLGWGHGDQEIFSRQEMIDLFDVDHCNNSAAVFDPEKLEWLNGHYIRQSEAKDLLPLVKEFLQKDGVVCFDEELLEKAVGRAREKSKTLLQMAALVKVLFVPLSFEEGLREKQITSETQTYIQSFCEALKSCELLNHDALHQVFTKVAEKHGVKLGKVANPIRVALSGQTMSLGAYDLVELLGKEESLNRLKNF